MFALMSRLVPAGGVVNDTVADIAAASLILLMAATQLFFVLENIVATSFASLVSAAIGASSVSSSFNVVSAAS